MKTRKERGRGKLKGEREPRLERSDVGKSTPPPLVQQNGTSRVQSGCFCGFRFLGPVSIGEWIRSAGLSLGPSYTKNLSPTELWRSKTSYLRGR